MKRIITTLLITLLMFSSLAVNISAVYEAKTYDSVTIDDDELNRIIKQDANIKKSDTIVKMYGYLNGQFTDNFTSWFANDENTDINTLITDSHVHYAILKPNGDAIFKGYNKAGYVSNFSLETPEYTLNFIKYALQPELVFAPDVAIYNIYYFTGETAYWDCPTVYYVTDKGDFILNQPKYSSEKDLIYMFPVEDFRSVAKTTHAYWMDLVEQGEGHRIAARKKIVDVLGKEALQQYLFVERDPEADKAPTPTDTEAVSTEPADKAWWSSISPWTWVAVVCGSVAVIGTVTLATVFIIRKKKTKN